MDTSMMITSMLDTPRAEGAKYGQVHTTCAELQSSLPRRPINPLFTRARAPRAVPTLTLTIGAYGVGRLLSPREWPWTGGRGAIMLRLMRWPCFGMHKGVLKGGRDGSTWEHVAAARRMRAYARRAA